MLVFFPKKPFLLKVIILGFFRIFQLAKLCVCEGPLLFVNFYKGIPKRNFEAF